MVTWILSILSIVGTWLNARKLRCCFYLWIGCNMGWLVWDIVNTLYSRALLDIVQTVFCVYGIIRWGGD